MASETRASVRAFIEQRFPLARDCSDDDSLLKTNIIDSLGILDLAGFVEEKFGIELTDDALSPENFDSIATIAHFIDRMRNPGGS